jgi:molecular chaperone IbpA
MTLWNTYKFDTANMHKHFVGADKLMQQMADGAAFIANTAMSNFPPYNLKKVEENKYVIEMAVAGFGRQDIEITMEDNKLLIKGNTKVDTEETDKDKYLYQGIAARNFTRAFTIADNVEIDNAELINGMLKLYLNHLVPEKKVKKIEVNEVSEVNTVSSKLKSK